MMTLQLGWTKICPVCMGGGEGMSHIVTDEDGNVTAVTDRSGKCSKCQGSGVVPDNE